MSEEILEIGGSTWMLWYGKKLKRIGDYYVRRSEKRLAQGRKTIISNPTCKFINPFTILINFTVDNTNKYQLILEGNYKEKYKTVGTEESPIPIHDMFLLIKTSKEKWYLKE